MLGAPSPTTDSRSVTGPRPGEAARARPPGRPVPPGWPPSSRGCLLAPGPCHPSQHYDQLLTHHLAAPPAGRW